MRRRDFLGILGSAAVAVPLDSKAQQVAPIVGFLCSASESAWTLYTLAFRKGLAERHFIDGKNVSIEYRWAENQLDRLPGMAADLVRRNVAVIVAGGGTAPAVAARQATSTIPILFAHGSDPVKLGMVQSLNRPGGNVTGVTFLTTSLVAKRLQLLRELLPGVTRVAALYNPDNSDSESSLRDLKDAMEQLGLTPLILSVRQERDLDMAFAESVQKQAQALLITGDRLFISSRDRLAALAAQYAVPTMHDDHLYPSVGGLIAYGPSIADAYRQIGVYTARILQGERPAELPVVRPNQFDLILNLRTAKALGITVPDKMIALADEVIE
jgi:putative ABC transport system substrate-binding protein